MAPPTLARRIAAAALLLLLAQTGEALDTTAAAGINNQTEVTPIPGGATEPALAVGGSMLPLHKGAPRRFLPLLGSWPVALVQEGTLGPEKR